MSDQLLASMRDGLDAHTRFWMAEEKIDTLRWALDNLTLSDADQQRVLGQLAQMQEWSA